MLLNWPVAQHPPGHHSSHPLSHLVGTYAQAASHLGYEFASEFIAPCGSTWRRVQTARSRILAAKHTWIILQGYGAHAVSLPTLFEHPSFIFHTWKVPFIGPHDWANTFNDYLHLHAAKKSGLINLVCLEQQRHFALSYPGLRTAWVPVCADTRWWTPGLPETAILNRLGVESGTFLLCVGDVDREETVPVLLARHLNLPLVRVSRAKGAVDRSREAAKQHGLKSFHGLVHIRYAELRDLHRTCWALLNAPQVTYHPAGLTTLTESMACGSVVLFPKGPTSEGYASHGDNVILFEELTLDCVLDACMPLRDEDRRRAIGNAARRRCEEFLNFEQAGSIVATNWAATIDDA